MTREQLNEILNTDHGTTWPILTMAYRPGGGVGIQEGTSLDLLEIYGAFDGNNPDGGPDDYWFANVDADTHTVNAVSDPSWAGGRDFGFMVRRSDIDESRTSLYIDEDAN